ncbi:MULTISPECIES: SagB/ThcOx family dehydrogenase [unclassified Streptomyces]|uniref:SagB/ThcOx family dehydrogenase n=1 Tax=unclassified Streptomyces TaxID=2593676 RepID=UPI001BE8CED0|nr:MULTISPECIES: SagB/ThcOx family dehydrogenase [unclassified Streptomyces]MBT2408673.1 SagB/ThcOx family dehydrogenase [Streptomyces sp. ISL-21]MBT2608643.1 SagB/ThcOx family dehydrogenase [Streptomyces sp. ISL-87]
MTTAPQTRQAPPAPAPALTQDGTSDEELAAALGTRPCDLPAVRSLLTGAAADPEDPPLRVRDLLHRRLRSGVCDDMIDPRALQSARPRPAEPPSAGLSAVPLPEPRPLPDITLAAAIEQRHSSTTFAARPMEFAVLAALLEQAAGIHGHRSGYNVRDFPVRRAPSAGGLAPIDLYVVANAVDGLEQGLYRYRPSAPDLVRVDSGNMRGKVTEAGIAADWMFHAPAVLFLAVDMPRVEWKYGVRSYRYVHVDLGVMTQNLYLVATALGLNTCAVAAFDDDAANDLLRLDGRDSFVSLMFACGLPGGR